MTNQEAIKTLRKLWHETIKYSWYEEVYYKAISALQAQDNPNTNVGDMVSKKAVELALIEKGWSSKRYKIGENWELNADEIKEALATVPPVYPEQQWIPVNERLPAKKEEQYWICTDTGYQCQCRWTNNCFGIVVSEDWGWKILDIPKYTKVVAWMPLPEPYEEEKKK